MEPLFPGNSKSPMVVSAPALDFASLVEGPVVVELLIAPRPDEPTLRATLTVMLVVRED